MQLNENTEALIIFHEKLDDLSFLPKNLPKLKKIVLHDCNLHSLKGIPCQLPLLEMFSICINSLQDLTYFPEKVPNLKELYLDLNRIGHIGGLPRELPALEKMSLRMNEIERFPTTLTDLNLPRLKEINLSKNCLESLKNIPKEMKNLQSIDISNNSLQNFIGLPRNLPRLQYLHASKAGLSGLDGFPWNTPNLIHLNLSMNDLKSGDLDFLPRNMENLEYLNLMGCKIDEISGLPPRISKLEQLNLSNNELFSLKGSPDLPGLRILNLGHNKLENFEGMPKCPNIESINVESNSNLSSFHGLEKKQMIMVARSMVESIYGFDFSDEILPDLRDLQVFGSDDDPNWDKLYKYYEESLLEILEKATTVEKLKAWERKRLIHEGNRQTLAFLEQSPEFTGKKEINEKLQEKLKDKP